MTMSSKKGKETSRKSKVIAERQDLDRNTCHDASSAKYAHCSMMHHDMCCDLNLDFVQSLYSLLNGTFTRNMHAPWALRQVYASPTWPAKLCMRMSFLIITDTHNCGIVSGLIMSLYCSAHAHCVSSSTTRKKNGCST